MSKLTLPTDSAVRKEYSIGRGCLAYFPAAIAGVARHSFKAGAKHTQGELIHKRWLSGDHEDCIERHLMDLRDMLAAVERDGAFDGPEVYIYLPLLDEANALAWRALALAQELHEKYGGAPLAPAARLEGASTNFSSTQAAHPEPTKPPPYNSFCSAGDGKGYLCMLRQGHAEDHKFGYIG